MISNDYLIRDSETYDLVIFCYKRQKKAEKKKGSWKGKRLGAYKGKDGEKEINENRRNEYDFVSRFILNMHRDALANRGIETCIFIRKNVRITYFYRATLETMCYNCNSSRSKNNSLKINFSSKFH